jgi:hypothetical protein
MQTFLPYSNFEKTFKCLDRQRLCKQRLEAKQIYNIITGKAKPNKNGKIGWIHHPCVCMWRGYANALALYHNTCIQEWIERGYNNNMQLIDIDDVIKYPSWIGNNRFHSAHRQTLLFKNPEWYNQFNWSEKPKYEYWWPV